MPTSPRPAEGTSRSFLRRLSSQLELRSGTHLWDHLQYTVCWKMLEVND